MKTTEGEGIGARSLVRNTLGVEGHVGALIWRLGRVISKSITHTNLHKPSNKLVVSQPHFEKSVRMKLTLPKWELGSPPGLPKLQSSIAGIKTPRIVAFFISLESYQNVDVENGLA